MSVGLSLGSVSLDKAAIKLHTLLDWRGNIPSFLHISDGKLHDVNVLDLLLPEPGASYIMDRGYIDFDRLYQMHEAKSFFVTRAKSNLKELHMSFRERNDNSADQLPPTVVAVRFQYMGKSGKL